MWKQHFRLWENRWQEGISRRIKHARVGLRQKERKRNKKKHCNSFNDNCNAAEASSLSFALRAHNDRLCRRCYGRHIDTDTAGANARAQLFLYFPLCIRFLWEKTLTQMCWICAFCYCRRSADSFIHSFFNGVIRTAVDKPPISQCDVYGLESTPSPLEVGISKPKAIFLSTESRRNPIQIAAPFYRWRLSDTHAQEIPTSTKKPNMQRQTHKTHTFGSIDFCSGCGAAIVSIYWPRRNELFLSFVN